MPTVTLLPDNRILPARAGENLHALLAREGRIDAPCGGRGTCGKCRVLVDGEQVLACRTAVDRDMTVTLPHTAPLAADRPQPGRALAFDIGTTTLACFLLSGDGAVLARAATGNPQVSYGADVVSRIQAAASGQRQQLTALIREAMTGLTAALCSAPEEIETVSAVGNPAMQQLFLGMELSNLAQIPFSSVLCKPQITACAPILPICPRAKLLTVPDISGFVGADTVAGVLACGMHRAEELTLLVDIGTNGELVLGSRKGMVACATAAGPALEGAGIRQGMRAAPGAIDRVWIEDGALRCRTVENAPAVGICGSGLIDAVACALELGLVNRRGKLLCDNIMLTEQVFLTQEDIRQVMLAKGAIAAGIRLLAREMGADLEDIQAVVLAGAFGAALRPESACRMGLLPEELLGKITAAGNAAGDGACLLAGRPELLADAGEIAGNTRYLDLSTHPAFPRAFARAMELREDWPAVAKHLGFDFALPFDPGILTPREDVRAMCAQDRCGAYGKNWTCPPHCGTVEECRAKMGGYRRALLLQTVGQLSKSIDTRGYRAGEQRHLDAFAAFCRRFRRAYPQALCLGSGGCRVCSRCAWPAPCRFPELATASMEGYGLFVTQVCRDCGAEYHHGEKTVTYTACVLF